MANTIPCGECIRYAPKTKPQRSGKTKDLGRGHCLVQTVYASNKPGNPDYPLGAQTAELPYGRHIIKMVRPKQIVAECTSAKRKQ